MKPRLAQEKEPPAEGRPRIIEYSALKCVKVVDKGVKHWLWCDALGEKDSNSFASLSLLTLTNQEVYSPEWLSWLERPVHTGENTGSSPVSGTIWKDGYSNLLDKHWFGELG